MNPPPSWIARPKRFRAPTEAPNDQPFSSVKLTEGMGTIQGISVTRNSRSTPPSTACGITRTEPKIPRFSRFWRSSARMSRSRGYPTRVASSRWIT